MKTKFNRIDSFLRLEGIAVLIIAAAIYALNNYNGWLFLGLLLAPDIFMVGYAKNTRLGALIYNIGHTLTTPALLAAIGYYISSELLYAIALIWVAHIGMDRMLGYGLKYPDDFKHTHLGWIDGNL